MLCFLCYHSMAWAISVDGRYTNANGQVIPHNHPCCIFLTIFIYFCCRCRESRGSIVGKARAFDGRYKRQGHEQLYVFSFIYTLTILFVLHLSRPWTVVYTSEVVVDHLRLFFNFQGKKKWQCTKDAPFVLALWWSYIPLSDSFFLPMPQGSTRTSKVSSWSGPSCSSSQGHYVSSCHGKETPHPALQQRTRDW